ncbi:DUF1206 domain-containing protein [Sulfitobacter sp. D35]|uniref:DUF1206 domain-containing protein n=1 Tax=Sulfitobacter sp. D35 TaxID=3083252 RepID=UPI00296EB34F|nr:DUF1206 domain-containing protein [Sulfitobacter sp. D35]MDW4499872.1 DUF1206 domain-containing protein [Sulfitobacter sp. D35]
MAQNDDAPGWVIPVMRTGYGARGVTYIILGVLAFLAAWTGGDAEGTREALAKLRDMPFGLIGLWLIALGFFCYAIWRLICAFYDLEDHGTDAKGLIARTGQTVTGLIHAGLGISVVRLATGSSSESAGDGGGAQSATSWVLSMPFGKWIVIAVGLITIGAGIYYGWKGIAEKYKEHLRCTSLTERLDPVVKAGLIAHGVVIALIGTFLIYAGLNTDPGQAGGIGKAFDTVRSQPYGQFLLGALGIGTVAFAIYCFIEAIYRFVPRLAEPDLTSLADAAEGRVRAAARSL